MQKKVIPIKVILFTLFFSGICLSLFGFVWNENNTVAPDIMFTTLKGEKIQLSELRGQPVIVSFWATDCASCIKEIPHLIELYNQYHSQGLEIIAVAMYYDPPNHVVAMTQAKKIPFYVALDLKSEHASAFGGVQLIPSLFLISPEGYIVKHKTGLFDLDSMQQNIEHLLKG